MLTMAVTTSNSCCMIDDSILPAISQQRLMQPKARIAYAGKGKGR
jgi:hypothetical protein